MKTASVRELRNQYRQVLAWVESGEEVSILCRGRPVARLLPPLVRTERCDWTQSAAFNIDRKGRPKLTAKQVRELLAKSRSGP